MKKLLILGVSGLLGINLAMEAEGQYQLSGVSRSVSIPGASFPVRQADLERGENVQRVIEEIEPDIVINSTALASLEACEADPQLAERLNVDLPRCLANICSEKNIRLLQISTDAVFDGERGDYREEDAVNPLSVYARTKWEGEEAVRAEYRQASIARVNFFGWSLSGTRSLAEFFYNNLNLEKPMKGLTDRFFNPLHASHLSQLLLQIIDRNFSGTLHVTSPISLSKYDFGVALANKFGMDSNLIEPASADEIGYQAARSPNLTLNVDKLKNIFPKDIPSTFDGLDLLLSQFDDKYPERMRKMLAAPSRESELI
jgi:dTDP-4-dehydrorhamnose reductase